jgi:hypothetical protein
MTVVEAHNHHAEVQKVGDDREQRRLLPAMLRGARRERAANLAVQGSARPKSSRLVEEIGHLRRQSPEPGAGTNDDRVVGSEIIDLCDRRHLI